MRVARSANGDGFAVWQADDGTRRNLWANRFRSTTSTWDDPINIEASNADIDDFDVTVDANGNAVVAWHEVPTGNPQVDHGAVMSARFSAGAWAMPMVLNTDASQPRVAADATGAVLAVYAAKSSVIRGRFFDPASGTWQAEAAIEQNTLGTGFSFGPVPLLDGSGNALVAFHNAVTGAELLASNYFSRSSGDWGKLPPDEVGFLGVVDGSQTFDPALGIGNIQLATTTGGNFLLAWTTAVSPDNPGGAGIDIARFTSGTRTWSAVQTLVAGAAQKNVQLQRIGSDAAGDVHVLWTENIGTRTALKAFRLDHTGTICSAEQVIDGAVGGGAARVDLGVNPRGDAIAIWQQFEGGRPDDGSRSNIAINGFDRIANAWASAVFAETQPGNAISPSASANGGRALLGWIQSEGGTNHVKALLQTLASDFVYTPIIFPGASATTLSDINNNGVIVGAASIGTADSTTPFVYANGTFTPFDPALGSFAAISDAGIIVGQKSRFRPFTSYILESGVTTLFEAQGATSGTTSLSGISPDGRYLVGTYEIPVGGGIQRSFVFDRQTGTQTNILQGSYELVFAASGGATNSGLVLVSQFELFTSEELFVRSYLFDLNTGILKNIDADNLAPGYFPRDINASGQIIGSYYATFNHSEQVPQGFVGSVFSLPSTFSLLDVPGSTPGSTQGSGINDSGTLVGFYSSPSGTFGYIATARR